MMRAYYRRLTSTDDAERAAAPAPGPSEKAPPAICAADPAYVAKFRRCGLRGGLCDASSATTS